MNKVVVACLTADDVHAVQQLSDSSDAQVIAVALDLGHGVGLRALHESALAAGAMRCHAIDVRDAFAHDCVLPAIDADTFSDSLDEMQARAREFVTKRLASIAALEGKAAVISPSVVRVEPAARTSRSSLDEPARVNIAFESGVPRAINGIAMSIVEALDVLGAIAAAHGIEGADAALRVLHAAHRELRSSEAQLTGSVQLEISRTGIFTAHPELATA